MSTVTEVTEVVEDLSPRRMLDGVPPDTRVIVADVTWDVYETMIDAVRDGEHCRIAFDGKNIEMLSLGPFHERQKSYLDLFIIIVTGELKIEHQPMGSTTWRRKKFKRGIESDLCYYFDPAKLAAAAGAQDYDDIDFYPNPDLAIEVDQFKYKPADYRYTTQLAVFLAPPAPATTRCLSGS